MIKLQAINLVKYFNKGSKNEVHAIDHTDLTFEDHGLVCLLGESGSGKTTLLNVLGGIDKADSGKILFEGNPYKCNDYKSAPIRNNKFGYVFQNYYMIGNNSVYENLYLALAPYHLPKEEIDERIDYVLDSVQMLKYKKRKMNQLSGGQQQRIAIARALIKSPDVIFADEPTGNLDESTTLLIMMILKNISKSCLVVLATHEKRIANFFGDRIISIRDGKVVDDKAVDKTSDNIYEASDDHNLYLKEYQKKTIQLDNGKINLYSNGDTKLDFNIIIEHDKYYIASADYQKFEIITKDSNIQAIDSKKPVIDKTKVEAFEYDLAKPSKENNGVLNFKYLLSKVSSSIRSKSFIIMIIALILISAITIWGVGDFITVSKNTVQDALVSDSRESTFKFSDGDAISGFVRHNTQLEVVNDIRQFDQTEVFCNAKFITYFVYEGVEQIEKTSGVSTTLFANYSLLPLEYVNESDIIYGKMPTNTGEIVVDEWVIEKFMKEENIISLSMSKIESFIGKKLHNPSANAYLKIVGISRAHNMSIYMNRYDIISIYQNTSVASFSMLKAAFPGVYDDYELPVDHVMINNNQTYIGTSRRIINTYYEVVDERAPSEFPYVFVVNDDNYVDILNDIISNDRSFKAISTNKEQMEKYAAEYASTPNFEKIQIKYTDQYKTNYNNYMMQRARKIRTRLLVTLSITAMCILTLFITMKAHASENMQTTMVYRLLGMKKRVVLMMYAVEIFITSLFVMIPTTLIVTGILEFLEHMPASTFVFNLSFTAYIITLISLFVLNIFVGILPVWLIMRKTPAALVSEYDL